MDAAAEQDPESDESLMLRYAAGDAAAFEQLYGRYRRLLLGYLVRQLRDRERGEELYQETWTRVIRAREGYRQSAAFRTWLFTIAHNLVTDDFRRRGRQAEIVALEDGAGGEPVDEAAPGPEQAMAEREGARELLARIGRLPFAQRDVILLRLEAGLGVGEIAAVTGADPEAVKSRLRYAVRRLRAEVEDDG